MTTLAAAVARLLLSCTTGVLLASCGLKPEEYEAIDAWLACDECIHEERERVDAIGDDAVPTLKRAVKEGPDSSRRAMMRRKFLDRYPTPGPAGLSASAYADQLVANYVANYRKRSAISLSDIGGKKAREALRDALADSAGRGYRSDVVRAILLALATTEMSTFAGSVTPSSVRFGDTVTVSQGAGLDWSGDEQLVLEGVPFPPADLVIAQTTTLLRFLAVGPVGTYPLGVTSLGASGVTQVADLTIRSLVDANDRGMLTCATLVCTVGAAPMVSAFPHTAFLSLWNTPPRPDTVDLFQFEPSAAQTVTARLDWPTGGNLDLRWRLCAPFSATTGNEDGATNGNPEASTVTIPGGECWVLVVSLLGQHPAPQFARLRVTSP